MKSTTKHILLAFLFVSTSLSIGSGQVTYTKQIAKIIYNKCTSCHRTGEIGPFNLTSYQETRLRANSIKAVTKSRYMPPWKADPSYQRHIGESFLSDEEIQLIADWVDGGTPYGTASEEPPLPIFPTGSALGVPDTIITFKQKHLHKGNGKDEYRYFVLPTAYGEDKVIKAIEVRPGNAKIVHHALIFQDVAGTARSFDAKTPEYGFEGMTGFSDEQVIFYDQYPGYAPGTKTIFYPDGIGQLLNKGADIVMQIHYAPTTVDYSDSTSVNIFFAKKEEKITRYVDDMIMLPFNLVSGPFSFNIPRNTTRTFEGRMTMASDLSLVGIYPHMHMLGKNWEVWLQRPDGTRENLIRINDWDFNWQSNYYFRKYIKAPKGSVVVAKATYDNTSANPNNPTIPPKNVSWGENTTDEMFFLPLLAVPYNQGDENITFNDITSTADIDFEGGLNIASIQPNPAMKNSLVQIDFKLDRGQPLTLSVFDMTGKQVRSMREGEYFGQGSHTVHLDPSSLPSGSYLINMSGASGLSHSKMLIIE